MHIVCSIPQVLHKTVISQRGKVTGRLPRSKNRAPVSGTGSLHFFNPSLCFSLPSLSLFPTPKAQCPYMVQLLHHYETQTNRIFLLLEHIHSGRLIDHVLSLRQVHKKNTTPSTDQGKTPQAGREEKKENKNVSYDREDSEELLTKKLASLEVVTSEPIASDTGEEEEDDPNMDKMLEELMSIDTPTNRVGHRSRRKKSPSPSNPEEDSLTRRRRLLMETMSESGPAESGKDNEEAEDKKKQMEEREEEEQSKELDHTQSTGIPRLSLHPDGTGSSETDTQINVIPPTPTTPRQPADPTSLATTNDDHLSSPSESSSQPTATADAAAKTGSSSSSRRSSGQCTPQFSPASLRNSPEPSLLADEVAIQLETAIREWAAQVVVALEHLHSNSIVYQ